MPSDIHEAANTTKEGGIAWFCPLKLYRHYSGCRIWSGLLYRNYIKLYVSFCAARPGFVAYLFVVQCTTAVLCRCFYIRFVLPLIYWSYFRPPFFKTGIFRPMSVHKYGWRPGGSVPNLDPNKDSETSLFIFMDVGWTGSARYLQYHTGYRKKYGKDLKFYYFCRKSVEFGRIYLFLPGFDRFRCKPICWRAIPNEGFAFGGMNFLHAVCVIL